MHTSRRTFLKELGFTAGALIFLHGENRLWADVAATLPRSTPSAEGVDPAGIHAFLDALAAQKMEVHSFMLMRHGRVVAEGWWAPYERSLRHSLYSLSKSFTSTAIGLLVADGKLNVVDKVASIFPDDLPATVSENLAAVRVKDLLTMSVGHAKDPTFEMIKSENWLRAFLAWPVEHSPGTHFVYNSGATYTLSAIVQKRTGKSVLEFLRERLFAPLGITDATWETCPRGICTGGWGLSVQTEALAKMAQLYLQRGVWNGKEILPASWAVEATSKQVQQPLPDKPARPIEKNDWLQGYGYQFWRSQHGAFRGDGAFGQYAIVMPEQDAVLAITAEIGNMQGEIDLVWERLIPAMKPGVAADAAADEKLRARLAALALPIPSGVASSNAGRISGKTVRFEKNTLGIESAAFTFTDKTCAVTFRDAAREHPIPCGLGKWQRGETALPGTPPRLVSGGGRPGVALPVSSAAAWVDDSTLALTVRFHETPHHDVLTFRFDEDKVALTFRSSIVALNPSGKDPRAALRGVMG